MTPEIQAALAMWENAAQNAHGGNARKTPLLTAAQLIEAGDALAGILRDPLPGPELPPALGNSAFGRSGCQLTEGEPLLASRQRGNAAECAGDAATLLREGKVTEAGDLLRSAQDYLTIYEGYLADYRKQGKK